MEKKIKVLMVGLLPPDLSVKGGVVAVILNLLSSFAKRDDLELIHVSFNDDISEPITKKYSTNITIQFIPFKTKIALLDYFINRKNFKKILESEKPNLIHIQEITPQLIRFINYPKKKIIVTQHGIMSEEIKTAIGLRNKLKSLFKGSVEKYIFPLFKNIIFISEYNKSLFPKKPAFSTKIFNPVNPIFFNTTPSSRKLNSIVYVGVINKNKNLKLVLEVLAILKRENIIFDLHVVGGYKQTSYEPVITSLVKSSEIESQVKFHGWLAQEQILEVYKQCSIFILPSQQENMPVSIGEAMAQGKIVIASNVGAISEMVTNKKSGFLFEKNNLDELINLLRFLYNNDEVFESVSSQAKIEAKEKFHPDHIASKTIEFYREVFQNSGTQ
jgi:glycosyltransferase involved in cell wall biosynthesis